jgi:signal transduction histidine kinase
MDTLKKQQIRNRVGQSLVNLSERIYTQESLQKGLRTIIIALLLATCAALVYFTGGTYLPFPHFFYVPIILANFLLGVIPGAITALIAGLIAGLIPLNVSQGTLQEPTMVLCRTVFFMLVSIIAGINTTLAHTFIDHLQEKVEEKTAALQKSYEELKELQEFKEFLSNTIVHDLQSSLASNLLSLRTLGKMYKSSLDGRGSTLLETAISSGNRLTTMISNILDVYADEKGELTITPSLWEPEKQLAEIVEPFQIQADLKELTLTMEPEPGLPDLLIDVELMRRTIENLIFNAIKHTPPGGTVTLKASARSDLFRVTVHNTGSVIPEEWKERVFEKFAIVDREARLKGGSGLGLAFCRVAVEAHGGRIWAESSEEKGTAFVFTLPVTQGS